jgi:hypothetical protein
MVIYLSYENLKLQFFLLVNDVHLYSAVFCWLWKPHDHLLLDSAPNSGPLISCWNLTNSKVAETKVLEPLKSGHFCVSNLSLITQRDMSGPRLGTLSINRWSGGTSLHSSFLLIVHSELNSVQTSHFSAWTLRFLVLASCINHDIFCGKFCL